MCLSSTRTHVFSVAAMWVCKYFHELDKALKWRLSKPRYNRSQYSNMTLMWFDLTSLWKNEWNKLKKRGSSAMKSTPTKNPPFSKIVCKQIFSRQSLQCCNKHRHDGSQPSIRFTKSVNRTCQLLSNLNLVFSKAHLNAHEPSCFFPTRISNHQFSLDTFDVCLCALIGSLSGNLLWGKCSTNTR